MVLKWIDHNRGQCFDDPACWKRFNVTQNDFFCGLDVHCCCPPLLFGTGCCLCYDGVLFNIQNTVLIKKISKRYFTAGSKYACGTCIQHFVSFRFLMATNMKKTRFWVVVPKSLVGIHRTLRGVCCLYRQGGQTARRNNPEDRQYLSWGKLMENDHWSY